MTPGVPPLSQRTAKPCLWPRAPPPRADGSMWDLAAVLVNAVMKIAVSTLRARVTARVMKLRKYRYVHMPRGEAWM